jgi:hypothetical protein
MGNPGQSDYLWAAAPPPKIFESRFRHYENSLGIHSDPWACTGISFSLEWAQSDGANRPQFVGASMRDRRGSVRR